MSASNEWFEYHLTPDGWIGGSEKIDFGAIKNKPVPDNRVLTLCFHEYMSSGFSKIDQWYTKDWCHENSTLVQSLIEKYGAKPESYQDGYKLRS